MPLQPELNEQLRGTWPYSCVEAPGQDPAYCCLGLWFPCCLTYLQRRKVLDMTGEPYLCLGRDCAPTPNTNPDVFCCAPNSISDRCCNCCCCCCIRCNLFFAQPRSQEDPTAQTLMFLEAFCCTPGAILTNRYMIQTRFDVANDPCDRQCMECLQCLGLVLSCLAICAAANKKRRVRDAVRESNELYALVVLCGFSCMLTQQHSQLQKIEEGLAAQPYAGPPAHIMAVLPPTQLKMVQVPRRHPTPGQQPTPTQYPPAPAQM